MSTLGTDTVKAARQNLQRSEQLYDKALHAKPEFCSAENDEKDAHSKFLNIKKATAEAMKIAGFTEGAEVAQSIITSVLAENAKKQNATLSKQKHLVKRVLEENLEKMLEAERKYDVSKHRSVIARDGLHESDASIKAQLHLFEQCRDVYNAAESVAAQVKAGTQAIDTIKKDKTNFGRTEAANRVLERGTTLDQIALAIAFPKTELPTQAQAAQAAARAAAAVARAAATRADEAAERAEAAETQTAGGNDAEAAETQTAGGNDPETQETQTADDKVPVPQTASGNGQKQSSSTVAFTHVPESLTANIQPQTYLGFVHI